MNRWGYLFLGTVIVPTFAAIIYLGFWASDVYVSESRYVIRSSQNPMSAEISMSFASFLGSSAILQDGYAVASYATSMDSLKNIDREINLKELFTSHSIDVFSRFASFYWNESNERLLKYLQKRVEISVDPISAISTLTVRTYTANSAERINEIILKGSETLVNQINERTRRDLISFAEYGVESARKNLEAADKALTDYRSSKNVDDTKNFIPKFQSLTLERDTAERQLGTALEALEQARVDAQRKMIYLERIVNPNLPDYPLEPYRILGILTSLILSLMLFGILKVVIASIKEHRD